MCNREGKRDERRWECQPINQSESIYYCPLQMRERGGDGSNPASDIFFWSFWDQTRLALLIKFLSFLSPLSLSLYRSEQTLHSLLKITTSHRLTDWIVDSHHNLTCSSQMLLNESTSIVTPRLVLRPYRKWHVKQYHQWLEDEELREQTASERLTIEEEEEMQSTLAPVRDKMMLAVRWQGWSTGSWRLDEDSE